MPTNRITYRPKFAEHVRGEFNEPEIDRETGFMHPVKVEMWCERCNGYWQTMCSSGHFRTHIAKFAVQHLHRDPFVEPMPIKRES